MRMARFVPKIMDEIEFRYQEIIRLAVKEHLHRAVKRDEIVLED